MTSVIIDSTINSKGQYSYLVNIEFLTLMYRYVHNVEREIGIKVELWLYKMVPDYKPSTEKHVW